MLVGGGAVDYSVCDVMGFDEAILLMCGAVWALHAFRLVRAPWERSWPAFMIVLLGLGVTIAGYAWQPRLGPHFAIGAVVLLLIVPATAVRWASRALRFSRFELARRLAQLAVVLRPLPVQRRFVRAVEVSRKLSLGETLDVSAALRDLGADDPLERAAHRIAFLSWRDDYPAMAEALDDRAVRAYALRSGMGAIIASIVGETGTTAELVSLYTELRSRKALSSRSLDAASCMVTIAAYLGDVATVEAFGRELRRDFPSERIALWLATAQQRAGRADDAEATVAAALAAPRVSANGTRRLRFRRRHPLAPIGPNDAHFARATLDDLRRRIRARQALAPLGLGNARPAPLTLGLAVALGVVFAWQSRQAQVVVFDDWGLVSPWGRAPDLFRLLSYAMLHVDTGHLFVNVLGLVIFGRFVEQHYGRLRFAFIYLGGALAGGGAFLALATRLGVAIGASGAVLGLFGATVARIAFDPPLRRSTQGRRELYVLLGIAAAQLVGDMFIAQSSGSAHAGGFVSGLVLGALLGPQNSAPAR